MDDIDHTRWLGVFIEGVPSAALHHLNIYQALRCIGTRFFFLGRIYRSFEYQVHDEAMVRPNLLSWFQCLFTSSESANEIDLDRGLDNKQITATFSISLLKYCLFVVLYAHLFFYQ